MAGFFLLGNDSMFLSEKNSASLSLPLLPLRDVVIFPKMVLPLFVAREKSIHALEAAMQADKRVFLVTQRNPKSENPTADDLYTLGTLSKILQFLRLPDGTVKVLLEGEARVQLDSFSQVTQLLDKGKAVTVGISSFSTSKKTADSKNEQEEATADKQQDSEAKQEKKDEENSPRQIEFIQAKGTPVYPQTISEQEEEALVGLLLENLIPFVEQTRQLNAELLTSLEKINEPSRLADTLASHLKISLQDKQELLEKIELEPRFSQLIFHLESRQEQTEIQKRVQKKVKQQMDKNQREYFLNEQIKVIHEELGQLDEKGTDLDQLAEKIATQGLSEEAKTQATKELKRLRSMQANSSEASMVRSYLDWLVNLPWANTSDASLDLQQAEALLNQEHYGLEEVKERILDYLAVQQRVKKIKGTVLCLVGPPGVGKTSLGESIAKAVNRKYVRLALGGVHDEAEIRGHRRTYLGSLPGKLIQRLSKVGVNNPLFLLDEIDKLGRDHRGDPASALLEVLDPEQNNKFNDNYLEVDYDLSDVMFVCTANSMNIPAPLLDRMEVIRIAGYTEDEKLHIAAQYLLPKQKKNAGLAEEELSIDDAGLLHIIRYYTKEAGVRQLERQLAKICRKQVRQLSNLANQPENKAANEIASLSLAEIEEFLGVRKYTYGLADQSNQVGRVTGLAWTSVGGELLSIEAATMPGKARLIKTGSLGEVMQESMQAALTVVRTRSKKLGIKPSLFEKTDIHLHLPEGATPKDGPSAGIGLCTALVSAFTENPVKAEVAMTGEINLRGEVLAIGGLKEKLLAARRGGIKTVILPEANEKDLQEVPPSIKDPLELKLVKWIDEVLEIALEQPLQPKSLNLIADKQVEAS